MLGKIGPALVDQQSKIPNINLFLSIKSNRKALETQFKRLLAKVDKILSGFETPPIFLGAKLFSQLHCL